MRLLPFRIGEGDLGPRLAQPKAQLPEQALALTHAQRDAVLLSDPDRQRFAIPQIAAQPGLPRRLAKSRADLFQLLLIQAPGPPSSLSLAQTYQALLLATANPILHRPRRVAQQPGHLGAGHSLGYQQHTVEAVVVAGILGASDLILQSEDDAVRVGYAQWSHALRRTHPVYYTQVLMTLCLEKHQQIRKDGYSRGIGGQSSGGICSLNAAWHRPDAFARVLSRIGSYTAIAWRTKQMKGGDVLDGGHFYPSMVRKEDKRNIRVWMEDGAEDLENDHGSWPLQNIQLANSLKMREYDFRFVFGNAQHNTAYGDSLLPEALRWLWRGYDPAKRCLGLETQYHVARNGDAARKNACATSEPDWVRRRRLTSM